MAQQRRSGVVVAGLLALTAGVAAADDRAIALTYEAPDACVDEATVRAEVTERRPSARFAVDGAVLAIARVRESPEGFVAELTIIEPGAAATSRLYPPVDHCLVATARLADALVVLFTDLPPPVTAPGEAPSPRETRPPESTLEAAVGRTVGANPTAAPTMALSVRRISGPWSTGGRGRILWDAETPDADEEFPTRFSSYNAELMFVACGAWRPLLACFEAGVGARNVSWSGTFDRGADLTAYGVGGVRVGATLSVTRRVHLIPAVELLGVTSQPATASQVPLDAEPYSVTAELGVSIDFGGGRSAPPKSQPGP
ncbi:MAG: hypothetical protein IPL61_18770 [Myxococcales bacterium]|nr:hypothetical protein [Myxococcales bacterium]